MRHFLKITIGGVLALLSLASTAQVDNQIDTGYFSESDSGSTLLIFNSVGKALVSVPDLFFQWGGDLYDDPAIQTSANARMGSAGPTPFEGFPWVMHHIRIFGPGSYSFDADCTAEQVETGITDCPVVQSGIPNTGNVIFPEGRTLTLDIGVGQIGAHLLGDWNGSKDIGVVQLWDINTVFAGSPDEGSTSLDSKGIFFNLVSVDADNDGIPGGRMVTGPLTGSNVNFNLNLTASFPLLSSQDSDSDGIPDRQDVIDNLVIATQQQGLALEGGNYVLESSTGNLVLGDMAATAAISTGVYSAIVDVDAIGVADPAVERACLGGCFSFTITSLSPEAVVDVVLPLSEAIPANGVVRKLIDAAWVDFDASDANAIMSASGSAGTCPGVAEGGWTEGLSVGDFCLKLTLVDGGVNDADGSANGVIKDPAGIAIVDNAGDTSNSGSGGGGGCALSTRLDVDPIWVISVLLLWVLARLGATHRRGEEYTKT